MHKVILYRLLQFPLILAVIYFLTFLLAWVAPGDPFINERTLDPVVRERLQKKYHAETPWRFLKYYPYSVLRHGDFGPSMQYKEWTVNDIIKTGLPVSVTLGVFALLIAVLVGVAVGTLAALRTAFLPVLSYLGPAAAVVLTGSFIVEKVFNIPGLGQHFVNSVLNRDRTLILGVVMVYSVFLLTFNLLVDIAYAWVDPRIDITAEGN